MCGTRGTISRAAFELQKIGRTRVVPLSAKPTLFRRSTHRASNSPQEVIDLGDRVSLLVHLRGMGLSSGAQLTPKPRISW
jgi:hypothetical protein